MEWWSWWSHSTALYCSERSGALWSTAAAAAAAGGGGSGCGGGGGGIGSGGK